VAVIESKYSLNWVRGVVIAVFLFRMGFILVLSHVFTNTHRLYVYLYDDGSVAVVISISVLFIVRVVFFSKMLDL
jgi:hypothetical protein